MKSNFKRVVYNELLLLKSNNKVLAAILKGKLNASEKSIANINIE